MVSRNVTKGEVSVISRKLNAVASDAYRNLDRVSHPRPAMHTEC